MTARRPNTLLLPLLTLGLCGMILAGFSPPESDTPTRGQNAPTIVHKDIDSVAQECVITFLNGRKITGILMESDEKSVVLRINGINTTYRRARLASVRFLPSVETRFRAFRGALPDSDIDGRLLLVDWLRDRRAYGLAVEELDSILELEPNHPQAKLLKTWLEQHLQLTKNRSARKKPVSAIRRIQSRSPIPLLSEEQINLIRVYEIDLTNPPKLIVENSTIKELMQRSPDSFPVRENERLKILKGSDLEKLKTLFRHKARDLYPQIQILEDPASFQFFKLNVAGQNGWLTNGCATARCHGGVNAGELMLSSFNPNSSQTLYTNFLILERFKLRDGTPMINYADPERSPLVQMGMSRSRSLHPHPEVDATKFGRDWRAVFRSTGASNFQRTIQWIRSLYTPRPDYGFEYPTPVDPDPPAPVRP